MSYTLALDKWRTY